MKDTERLLLNLELSADLKVATFDLLSARPDHHISRINECA